MFLPPPSLLASSRGAAGTHRERKQARGEGEHGRTHSVCWEGAGGAYLLQCMGQRGRRLLWSPLRPAPPPLWGAGAAGGPGAARGGAVRAGGGAAAAATRGRAVRAGSAPESRPRRPPLVVVCRSCRPGY